MELREIITLRPLVMQRNGGWNFFYTHDGNKNVSDVVSFQQARGVPAHYEYAPFGEVTVSATNTAFTAFNVSTTNPYRFSSEYADDALGLVYYNYRHYNQLNGRWTSIDPIEVASSCRIVFCGNNPIGAIDFVGGVALRDGTKFALKMVKILARNHFGTLEDAVEETLDILDVSKMAMVRRGVLKCMEGKEIGECDACCIITGRELAGDPPKYMLISADVACGACEQHAKGSYVIEQGLILEFATINVSECD